MNEVIISAGKSGRIMSGYTFTEKENDVLDKVKILHFGAANVFEFWIARIIRKDKNWRENEKDQKQFKTQEKQKKLSKTTPGVTTS